MEPHEVIWEIYPSGLTAIRTPSTARREQGEVDRVVEDFERAPALDPRHAVARVGTAAAYGEREKTRTAWGTSPALDQLRGELMRLRSALGGIRHVRSMRAEYAAMSARGVPPGDAASAWRIVLADVETAR